MFLFIPVLGGLLAGAAKAVGLGSIGTAAKAIISKVGPSVAKAVFGKQASTTGQLATQAAARVGGAVATGAAVYTGARAAQGVLQSRVETPYGPVSLPGGTPPMFPNPPGFGPAVPMPYSPAPQVPAYAGDMGGLPPIVASPIEAVCYRAPKGYSVVTLPDGRKAAVLTKVAHAMGLKKRPRKNVILSRRDIQGAMRTKKIIEEYSTGRTTAKKLPIKKRR